MGFCDVLKTDLLLCSNLVVQHDLLPGRHVSPVKEQTISRLELLSALHADDYCVPTGQALSIGEPSYFTDSKVCTVLNQGRVKAICVSVRSEAGT